MHQTTKRVLSTIVSVDIPEQPLDQYLAKRFSYLSLPQWQNDIQKGKISCNGLTAHCDLIIKPGDVILYDGRDIIEPHVDDNIDIVLQTDQYIVFNKPGDLPVHPAGRYFNNTLTRIMGARLKRELFPVHRIDRETSGLLLCAFTSESAARLSVALVNGEKEYHAIVRGVFPEKPFTIDMPLGPDNGSVVRKKRAAYPEASESAQTRFERVSTFGGFSLIRAYPQTGRLHQIRAHCEYAGYPIVGDKMYGGNPYHFICFIETGMTTPLLSELLLTRSALHASRLIFTDPFNKKEMNCAAPLPMMFTEFIDKQVSHG